MESENREGLRLKARLDRKSYKNGQKITDEQKAELNKVEHKVNLQCNYTIYPGKPKNTKKGMKKKEKRAGTVQRNHSGYVFTSP